MVKPRLGEEEIKRHRFRNTALAALAAALVSLLPAVASADATLKFFFWQVDEDGTGDWWKEAIAEFESENPGVTIEFTKVNRGNCADTMTTLFAGGEPPQIVHLASFEYQNFAENGWMENLDPWLEADGIDLTGWASQGTCRWNCETACVMLLYFGFMMAYNAEILAAEGLDVPTAYAELLDVERKTTKNLIDDGIIDQFGTGQETKGGAGQYLAEMLNYLLDAGAYWTNKQGEVTIDTPEMIEGLTR
ncbi:MAG: extracellular solute-binding protein, partial [Rhodobacteraceae bacterium]|nr:extracellular solute-binding protein [Paracoccaceae bacterium]